MKPSGRQSSVALSYAEFPVIRWSLIHQFFGFSLLVHCAFGHDLALSASYLDRRSGSTNQCCCDLLSFDGACHKLYLPLLEDNCWKKMDCSLSNVSNMVT